MFWRRNICLLWKKKKKKFFRFSNTTSFCSHVVQFKSSPRSHPEHHFYKNKGAHPSTMQFLFLNTQRGRWYTRITHSNRFMIFKRGNGGTLWSTSSTKNLTTYNKSKPKWNAIDLQARQWCFLRNLVNLTAQFWQETAQASGSLQTMINVQKLISYTIKVLIVKWIELQETTVFENIRKI